MIATNQKNIEDLRNESQNNMTQMRNEILANQKDIKENQKNIKEILLRS